MAIIRWDPLQMMRWPNVWDWDEDEAVHAGNNLDVYETQDEVVVKANVAGVKPEKVDITFEKGVLWVRAEEESEEKEGKKYYRKATRSYSYKVGVPGNIDLKNEPNATINDGVVMVTFKKAEEAKPKKIALKAQAS
jgi:HSP20 family protein